MEDLNEMTLEEDIILKKNYNIGKEFNIKEQIENVEYGNYEYI